MASSQTATKAIGTKSGRNWLTTCCCSFLLLSSLSCASIDFATLRVDTPPPSAAVEQVTAGKSNLSECLSLLGAPTSVDKSDDGKQFVLTWNWVERSSWGFNVSIPVSDRSASFNWTDSEVEPQFVRLFFDLNWRLIGKAQG